MRRNKPGDSILQVRSLMPCFIIKEDENLLYFCILIKVDTPQSNMLLLVIFPSLLLFKVKQLFSGVNSLFYQGSLSYKMPDVVPPLLRTCTEFHLPKTVSKITFISKCVYNSKYNPVSVSLN